jgi:tetratricopeptide (TPR) repeat protein
VSGVIFDKFAFSPDWKHVVACRRGDSTTVYQVLTGKKVLTLENANKDNAVGCVDWSPDGDRIVTANGENLARLWDAATGQELMVLNGHEGLVQCVAFSPDGGLVVAGSKAGTTRVWETQTGNCLLQLSTVKHGVKSVAFSPDGKRILAAGGTYSSPGQLKVWDTETGQELFTLEGHSRGVNCAIFSPDGSRIFSASEDQTVKIWDAARGDEILTLRGHTFPVKDIDFSPDGTRFVTCGQRGAREVRGEVKVWDASSGLELLGLEGLREYTTAVAWSPHGHRIMACGRGGGGAAFKIWDAGSLIDKCDLISDRDEMAKFIAGLAPKGDVLKQLAEDAAENGLFQLELARHFLEQRNRPRADLALARARAFYEARLASNPDVAAWASGLAEALLVDTTPWTSLKPLEMESEGGAAFNSNFDGSIVVSGANVAGDVYQIAARSPITGVKAVRLEVLPDQGLPNLGPGRHATGNFQLGRFRAYLRHGEQTENLIPLTIVSAVASYTYPASNVDIMGTIDPSLGKVWHIWGQFGEAHQAFFLLSDEVEVTRDSTLIVELQHHDIGEAINLGRFRLSVTEDPSVINIVKRRAAAAKITTPWAKLAAAYYIVGDHPAVKRVLEQHGEAAAGIGDLHASDGDWQRAIVAYSKAITSDASSASLLAKRTEAYIATKQCDLAKADWLRAIEQQPQQLQQAFDVFRTAEQWSTAAEFGQRFVEQNPNDSMLWLKVGVITFLAIPDGEYSEFCSRLTKQFGETNDVAAVGRLIKPLLLNDSAPSNAAKHFGDVISRRLEDNTTPQGVKHWRWGALAWLAYRSNDPEATVQLVAKSAEFSPSDLSQALNLAVLAMAQHELDHPDEAAAALAEASQLITRLKEDPNNKGHHDLLIAEILFREAEAKITVKNDSADEASTPPEKPTTTPAEEPSKANSDEPGNGDGN